MSTTSTPYKGSWRRRLLFSLVPVTLLVVAVEVGLRAAGWEGSSIAEIQAVQGFAHRYYVAQRDRVLGPWFEKGRSTDGRPWARSNPKLVPRGFHNQNFPIDPADKALIFALGGSTTQGIPYEKDERGFPQRLEGLMEGQGWRGRPVQIINAGVAGMDSSAFPRMAREAVDLGADALIIYAGNNEILGQLLRECADPYREGLARLGNRFITIRWVRSTYREMSGWTPPRTQAMVDDQQTCLDEAQELHRREQRADPDPSGPRSDPAYLRMLWDWEQNIDDVLDQADAADIPVWLAIPAVNLRTPPVLGEPPPAIEPERFQQVSGLISDAWSELGHERPERALELAGQARELAPTHAKVLWLEGEAHLALGRPEMAAPLLQLAVDHDWMGRRATSDLIAVVQQRCEERAGVHCVDIRGAFEEEAPQGIPGDSLFVDFCHPNRKAGTQLIAEAFQQAMTTD